MPTTELFVSLKVFDNVAITTFHTLERMGYKKLKNVKRMDYYKFEYKGNENSFKEKISKVDILVNANKHLHSFSLEDDWAHESVNILVQDIEKDTGLLSFLKNRLGFKNLRKAEKGILWALSIDTRNVEEAKKMAEEIGKKLLINENYQEMVVFG